MKKKIRSSCSRCGAGRWDQRTAKQNETAKKKTKKGKESHSCPQIISS